MMASKLAIAALLAQVASTLASETLPGLFVRRDTASSLFARQVADGPPPECASICDPVTASFNTCRPSTCCNSGFTGGIVNCALCVGRIAGVTDYSELQNTLHELALACNQAGFPIVEPQLPGQPVPVPVGGGANPGTTTSQTPPRTTDTVPNSPGIITESGSISNTSSVPTTRTSSTSSLTTSIVQTTRTDTSGLSTSTLSQKTVTTAPESARTDAPPSNAAASLGSSSKLVLAFVALVMGVVLQ